MIQFAHVAGPGMLMKRFERRGIESGDVFAIALRVAVKEMVRQEIDVFAAVAQRRQVNLNGVQTEEQTLEHQSRSHLRCRLLLEKKQNPHVHADVNTGAAAGPALLDLVCRLNTTDRKRTRLTTI